MSDIVKRLRDWADPDSKTPVVDTDDLATQAANEIERLRAMLTSYRTAACELAGSVRDEGFHVDLRKDYGIDDPDLSDCRTCGGSGDLNWGTPEYGGCPDCNGTGTMPERKCLIP